MWTSMESRKKLTPALRREAKGIPALESATPKRWRYLLVMRANR